MIALYVDIGNVVYIASLKNSMENYIHKTSSNLHTNANVNDKTCIPHRTFLLLWISVDVRQELKLQKWWC